MSRLANDLSQSYLKALLAGDRNVAREVIESCARTGGVKFPVTGFAQLTVIVAPLLKLRRCLAVGCRLLRRRGERRSCTRLLNPHV